MASSDSDHRRNVRLLLVAGVLSLLASIFAGGEATRKSAMEGLATRSLAELSFLAGVRGQDGERLRSEPLEVQVVLEGGEWWIRDAVVDAVDASPDFDTGDSQHLLRIETVQAQSVIALQLRLWRQGWDLRTPDTMRVRVAPWAGVFAGVLGAVLGFFVWRVGAGLLVAGLMAQAMVAGLPWPAETIPPVSWSDEVLTGPLLGTAIGATRALPSWGMPAAIAVIVFCVVLIAFDHRHSKGRKDSLPITSVASMTLLAGGGGLLWVEAATRAGLWSAMDSIPGAFAVLALALAWVPAIRRARERLRG